MRYDGGHLQQELLEDPYPDVECGSGSGSDDSFFAEAGGGGAGGPLGREGDASDGSDDSDTSSSSSSARGRRSLAGSDVGGLDDDAFAAAEPEAPAAAVPAMPPGPADAPPAPPAAAAAAAAISSSAASSSGGPWAPVPEAVGRRIVVLIVEGGKLVYYPRGHIMTAECGCAGHGKCVLTRTCRPAEGDLQQGRPLGLFLAWLKRGRTLATKDDHWSPEHWPAFEERRLARADFQAVMSTDAQELRAVERKQVGDEGLEPVSCKPPRRRTGVF